MRHVSLSRQESWNWLSPHDMHFLQYTLAPDSRPLPEDASTRPSPCQNTVSSLFGKEENVSQPHMSNGFNIGNMKINHRSRESRMSETLLYMHNVLSVLQEMRGSTVTLVVCRDGMVENYPCQGVLENDTWKRHASLTPEGKATVTL